MLPVGSVCSFCKCSCTCMYVCVSVGHASIILENILKQNGHAGIAIEGTTVCVCIVRVEVKSFWKVAECFNCMQIAGAGVWIAFNYGLHASWQ